jgi:flagellar biosynthetic protein FliP
MNKKLYIFLSVILLMAEHCWAEDISFSIAGGSSLSARIVQIILLTTVITLAPSILIMVTSFS